MTVVIRVCFPHKLFSYSHSVSFSIEPILPAEKLNPLSDISRASNQLLFTGGKATKLEEGGPYAKSQLPSAHTTTAVMGRKRKRTKALDTAPESEQSILHHRSKRARSDNGGVDKGEDPKKRIPIVPDKPVEHPVLACYFAQVFTLREHLLKLLVRIKSGPRPLRKLKAVTAENDADLSILLDTTLVGISGKPSPKITKQVHDHHVTQSSAGSRDSASQSEVLTDCPRMSVML